jgi:enterobacterial common antigen flippase
MNQDISEKQSKPGGDQINSILSPEGDGQAIEEAAKSDKHTYGQILKSSALIGGSTVINIGIRIIRTKAMALILGPSGVGLMGLYESITDLTQSIVGMGVNNSGVRQIAEAVGSDDTRRIAKTAQVLQRTSIFLGLLGAAFLLGFSAQLSEFTFGSNLHSNGVALLSLAVFFNLLSAGQGALIQGMRRISDLAKMSILGTLFGAIISIPTVFFLHEDGVVPSIILISAMGLITSWWYKRKIIIPAIPMISSQVGQEQAALLKLGFAFMSTGLMTSGASYVIRLFIVRNVGFDAAGLYQSAWGLGGLYIGFILQAMGTDFYPRLTAIVKDNIECNRVVNEQAHVSLLLAGPGVIATLTLAPLIITLFYSAKFEGAVELLRWLCLGMTLRVISWPMGYIIVAKNDQKLFIFAEAAWTLVYLGLAWVCVTHYGLNGAGIAFFGSYIFHVFLIYIIVRQLNGFRWSAANLQTCIFYLGLIGIVFSSYYFVSPLLAIVAGLLAIAVSSVYSVRVLVKFISPDRIPKRIFRLLLWLRLTSSSPGEIQAETSRPIKMKPTLKSILLVFMIFALICSGFYCYRDFNGLLIGIDFYLTEFKAHIFKLIN